MQLRKHQKENLAEFLVNIATAWFVGGIVTPMFTPQPFSAIMIFDLVVGLMLTVWTLKSSWEIYK